MKPKIHLYQPLNGLTLISICRKLEVTNELPPQSLREITCQRCFTIISAGGLLIDIIRFFQAYRSEDPVYEELVQRYLAEIKASACQQLLDFDHRCSEFERHLDSETRYKFQHPALQAMTTTLLASFIEVRQATVKARKILTGKT